MHDKGQDCSLRRVIISVMQCGAPTGLIRQSDLIKMIQYLVMRSSLHSGQIIAQSEICRFHLVEHLHNVYINHT